MQPIRCQHCKNDQPIENFHKHKNMPHGVYPLCKACKKQAYLKRSLETGHTRRLRKSVGSFSELKCRRCGLLKEISNFYTMKGGERGRVYRVVCKACEQQSQKEFKDLRTKTQPKLAWAHRVYGGIANRAKETGVFFDLTFDQLLVLNEQDFCAYCDVKVDYAPSKESGYRLTASTDRIIPKLGYTLQNLVIACLHCNWIKNDASPEEIIKVGTRLAEIIKARKL